jgi:quercetin dioxygenase-like cupin family protein
MIIQNKELNTGDIFIIHPNEIADPIFLEDCKVLIVKTPSIPGDKYVI